jgi:hypothetical protein
MLQYYQETANQGHTIDATNIFMHNFSCPCSKKKVEGHAPTPLQDVKYFCERNNKISNRNNSLTPPDHK